MKIPINRHNYNVRVGYCMCVVCEMQQKIRLLCIGLQCRSYSTRQNKEGEGKSASWSLGDGCPCVQYSSHHFIKYWPIVEIFFTFTIVIFILCCRPIFEVHCCHAVLMSSAAYIITFHPILTPSAQPQCDLILF